MLRPREMITDSFEHPFKVLRGVEVSLSTEHVSFINIHDRNLCVDCFFFFGLMVVSKAALTCTVLFVCFALNVDDIALLSAVNSSELI